MTSTISVFASVEADLELLSKNLKELIGARHPILHAAAEHLFGAGGKRLRPAVVFLVARATLGGGRADGAPPSPRRNYRDDPHRQPGPR